MNTNDPYIIAALGSFASLPGGTDASPSEVDFRAEELREADRDRAVLARRKAGDMRHIAAIAGTTEWVPLHPPVNLNDGRLPTAAFDWPIYRAAIDGNARRTETLESFADSNRDAYAEHVRGWFDSDTVRAVLDSGEWGALEG